ncbi:methionyl-tRNA formyltransferase [Ruania halotolerans]|uniref:methionyl-tRNA formyltransferase n=1 Tax=Ruania halotolerans TaxID=2897773 RepID=UPI001E5185DD|nr:methionyl-tRNA formyltransferase [Ruania halotolerans]UFU08289.1 methionyl-tRNA formyltransferase [Ruania halotolerans]
MRVVFAGTPAVAVPSLLALLASDHEVVGVLTRPPAPVGRKRVLTPSPVHTAADDAGIPVLTSDRPHEGVTLAGLRELAPEVCAVVAYGALLREPALSLPEHGWINLHFSLLPAWRGAAPVQHAIIAGDEITGASTFQIETGLDTGPVLGTMTEAIRPTDTSGDLLERLATSGSALLTASLDAIADGSASPQAQPDEGVSLAPRLTTADGQIDWRHPAAAIDRRIRGCTPAPGAWTTRDGARVKIGPIRLADTSAAGTSSTASAAESALAPGHLSISDDGVMVGTGTAPVLLGQIAPPGKSWMAATDWARGARLDSAATFDVEGPNT